MNSLNTSIDDIKSRVTVLEGNQSDVVEIKADLGELGNSINDIRNRVKILESSETSSANVDCRIRELESALRKSRSHGADLESMIRGNNIVIYGIVEQKSDTTFTVVKDFFKSTLGLQDSFVDDLVLGDALRMGTIKPALHRPVKVKFTRREDKRVVLGKYLDTRSEFIKAGVRIRDDLSIEIRKFRADAYPLFEALMEKGEKPRFDGNTIVCGKKSVHWAWNVQSFCQWSFLSLWMIRTYLI